MKNLFALTMLALGPCILQAQNIYTIAGNGLSPYCCDGGPATAAEVSYPAAVGLDASGNVYIADGVERIRKVSTAGIITTFAGNGNPGYSGDGGQATAAKLDGPAGVGSDALGNIYIADYANSRIRKVTPAGIITTFAGNGTAGYSGDGGQATAAEIHLYLPNGICSDTSGNIYFVDSYNSCVRKVTVATGIITTIAGNGSYGYSGNGGPATAAEFEYPCGVALDTAENVYIADEYNHVIRKVTVATGIITAIAGNSIQGYFGDGGQATAAEFDYPDGLGLDASGNIYIADYFNHRIRKVTVATGIITTFAGNGTANYSGDGGPATAAEINYPTGVSLDASGNAYISDYQNNRVREVTNGSPLLINGPTAASQNITVSPNPNNGLFKLVISPDSYRDGQLVIKNTVEVYNMLGEKIYTAKLNSSTSQIDLSNNANGIYLYRVLTETGTLVSGGKFIIQK
jgi:sugar lactone lactonase YvrE